MNKRKIFNDPVYGFISIPSDLIYDLIQHPSVQRLRRISQLGLTSLTYPGALHTRFHHALGALHLMMLTIEQLRQKGTIISDEEAEAAYVAILLHDIGHGPFSHALEHRLVRTDHETLSLALMQKLNHSFGGQLEMAIAIFQDQYPKRFLHQLISGQLDMDRLDYLNRDSFYSGVMEGKIGYDRIIKMLRVQDDQLVVEEKGFYSIEKFLVARKIMYWQVYLHKTVLAAELMLIAAVERAQVLWMQGAQIQLSPALEQLFARSWEQVEDRKTVLEAFVNLDDHDIMMMLKHACHHPDFKLQLLANGLINRWLFRLELSDAPVTSRRLQSLVEQVAGQLGIDASMARTLVWQGEENTHTYNEQQGEIRILLKDGHTRPLSAFMDPGLFSSAITRHYLCYPKVG